METNEMDTWGESWSSSDSDETGSSLSDDSNSSLRMEAVRVGGENLLLPQGLCDRSDVFREMLSMDTWHNFTDQQKDHLKTFLPNFPENDTEEKGKTLKMLFSRENIRFGNPLTEFHNQLKAAYFRPDVSKMRTLLRKAKYKDYKRAERWRNFELVKAVLGSRQRLVDAVVNGEKPKVSTMNVKKPRRSHAHTVKSRYFHELALIREEVGESSQSSEDDNYPEGPSLGLSKKPKRQAYLMEHLDDGCKPVLGTLSPGPSPWDQGRFQQNNPYATNEQSYTQMLVAHSRRRAKREEHPSLQTDGITLNEIAQRCKFLKRPSTNHKPVSNKKAKLKIPRTSSASSPLLEEFDMDDSSASEGTASTMAGIKQEAEEECERVDIEGVDDLPSLPMVIRTGLSNNNQLSSPKNSKSIPVNTPRRIKPDPGEPQVKRPSTDHTDPHSKKVRGSDTAEPRQRKIKTEPVSDIQHTRKIKTEPIETPVKKIKMEPNTIDHSLVKVKVEAVEPSPVQSVFPVLVKSTTNRVMTPATLSDLDGIDMMDLPVDFDESSAMSIDDMKRPELMQDTYACFFSLIRDILTSTPDHRIEMRDLETRVKFWASSPIGPINHWYTPHLESQLASAVQFLTGDSSEILPEDYVPYMEYKAAVGAYQWIGAGRDSDHRLTALCSIWLERGADRGGPSTGTGGLKSGSQTPAISGIDRSQESGGGDSAPPPPPRGPAVQPTSQRDRDVFRIQEKLRYERPYRAFTYNIGGTWTTVGPVRNCNSIRARGHSLLIESRPKCVSILELVRDAVARLPNGQGTRADIVTLLKDSQFLLETAPEGVLSSGVSGALDRLHLEPDPCVKYDPKRKTWVYLHKGRTQEEFERLHALGVDVKISRPRPPRKPAKPKKDAQPKEDVTAAAAIAVTSEPSSETSAVVTIRTAGGEGSPLVVQARGSGGAKSVTLSSTRKVIAEGVKSLLGKSRTIQQGQDGSTQQIVATVSTAGTITGMNKTVELQKAIATSSGNLPTRTIIQEATISVPTSQHLNLMKKTPQSVTIATEQIQKQGNKSIVKVITTSQPSTVNAVRTVQRSPQISQQQVIQLKQQLLGDQKLLQVQKQQQVGAAGTTVGVKKPMVTATGKPQQGQQQLIVMKQGGGGEQGTPQQMIVINQQQVMVDPQLTVKQQKQLQQLLSKQQLEQQGGVTIQQQLQQLILAKQQQGIVVEQKAGVAGGGTATGKIVGTQGGQQQMIVVKQQAPAGSSGGQVGGEKQGGLQQMILLKQGGQGGSGQGETHQITQQQLQQMLLLKQQQQQQQQMIIVKQDQKAVQVIAQPAKGQTQQITLAQLQQFQQHHQQQQQQRNSAPTSLLTHPRVVTHVSGTTTGGTSLIKPQSTGVVAKVVSSPQVLSMESLLQKPQQLQQQGTVRMPAVSRTIPSQQYTVVSVPQQRVVQTTNVSQATSSSGLVTGVSVTTTDGSGPKFVTAGTNMRLPSLNLTQIAGKQVLLASKPQSLQGQNVILGNSGGGTVLVASQGSPGQQGTLTVLQQGSQQILLPPGALNLKALQGLKVIPLTKQPQGKQQVFARIINPGSARPVVASVVHQDPNPPATKD